MLLTKHDLSGHNLVAHDIPIQNSFGGDDTISNQPVFGKIIPLKQRSYIFGRE